MPRNFTWVFPCSSSSWVSPYSSGNDGRSCSQVQWQLSVSLSPWAHTFGSKATKRRSRFLSRYLRTFRWFKASCRPVSLSTPISLRQRCSQSGSTRYICASRGRGALQGLSLRWRIVSAVGISTVLTAAVALPLVPGQTELTTRTGVPPFFSSAAVDVIPQDGVVLAYPYPDFSGPSIFYQPTHDIMLDQAVSGMRFKLIGGYGWFPSPTGEHGTTSPSTLEPSDVQELFDSAYYGRPPPKGNVVDEIRVFLRKFDVESVVLLPEGADPALVINDVAAAIGCPDDFGGVRVWSDIGRRLGRDHVNGLSLPSTCESVPKPTTRILTPRNGAILSGRTVLGTSVTSYSGVSKVTFLITGGSEHDTPVATARLTPVGWLVRWDTTTVPNGTYKLRSVASNPEGTSGSGVGITVSVKN